MALQRRATITRQALPAWDALRFRVEVRAGRTWIQGCEA